MAAASQQEIDAAKAVTLDITLAWDERHMRGLSVCLAARKAGEKNGLDPMKLQKIVCQMLFWLGYEYDEVNDIFFKT